jgi:hypothetical protein
LLEEMLGTAVAGWQRGIPVAIRTTLAAIAMFSGAGTAAAQDDLVVIASYSSSLARAVTKRAVTTLFQLGKPLG